MDDNEETTILTTARKSSSPKHRNRRSSESPDSPRYPSTPRKHSHIKSLTHAWSYPKSLNVPGHDDSSNSDNPSMNQSSVNLNSPKSSSFGSHKRGVALWGNLRAAREASTSINVVSSPNESPDMPKDEAVQECSQTKIMKMAMRLKQEQIDRQAHTMSTYLIDALGKDQCVNKNNMYSVLHHRGLMRTARLNFRIDPEQLGMLATRDLMSVRWLFYGFMLFSGVVDRLLNLIPEENDGNRFRNQLIVFQAIGALIGGVFGDMKGRLSSFYGGLVISIAASIIFCIVFDTEHALKMSTINLTWSNVTLSVFFTGSGICLPTILVLISEYSASQSREYVTSIGFFCKALGDVIMSSIIYLLGLLWFRYASVDYSIENVFRRITNSTISSETLFLHSMIWIAVILSGLGLLSLIIYTHINKDITESYIWKNKAIWLSDVDQSEINHVVDTLHQQNVKKTQVLYPGQEVDGARSNELIISSSENIFESSEYEELCYSEEKPTDLRTPLIKRMNTLHQLATKKNYRKRIEKWFIRIKNEILFIFRNIDTYLSGLYEFTLGSGQTVRLEIFSLMFLPFMSFLIQKLCEQGNLFYPIRSDVMDYAHYHLLITTISLPIFVITGVILIYYTPKFLQLIAFIIACFISFGIALSLFSVDGAHFGTNGSPMRLEDFYYSAVSYESIFHYGLRIPMITTFIMSIGASHTRLRCTLAAMTFFAANMGFLTGSCVTDYIPVDWMSNNRFRVLMSVCGTFLIMIYILKSYIPNQHVQQYDLPELHTIDMALNKRFPERKDVLIKELEEEKQAEQDAISGLHTLTANSLSVRMQF